MSDLLFILDADGRLSDCNVSAVTALALPGGKWVGCRISALPAPWPDVLGNPDRKEFEHNGRDFHVTREPLRSANGLAAGWLILLHDVSDLKRAEERLREAHHLEMVGPSGRPVSPTASTTTSPSSSATRPCCVSCRRSPTSSRARSKPSKVPAATPPRSPPNCSPSAAARCCGRSRSTSTTPSMGSKSSSARCSAAASGCRSSWPRICPRSSSTASTSNAACSSSASTAATPCPRAAV